MKKLSGLLIIILFGFISYSYGATAFTGEYRIYGDDDEQNEVIPLEYTTGGSMGLWDCLYYHDHSTINNYTNDYCMTWLYSGTTLVDHNLIFSSALYEDADLVEIYARDVAIILMIFGLSIPFLVLLSIIQYFNV